MDRVFLDANVLFSAAYREHAGLAGLWQVPEAKLITSAYAAEEARRNLEIDDQRQRLEKLLILLECVGQSDNAIALDRVDLPAKDRPILLAAIRGHATHLLTGEIRHLGPLFGTTIGGACSCNFRLNTYREAPSRTDGLPPLGSSAVIPQE